jgi:hypothetical protein
MPETVSILGERTTSLPVAPGVSKPFVAITYVATGLAPRIAYVEAEKDTVDERKRVIAEDIKAARSAPTRTIDLP